MLINIITKLSQSQFYHPQYLKMWNELLNIVINMDSNDLDLGISLLNLMRYKKGPKVGKIFSKHLQIKAYNFIETTIAHCKQLQVIVR